MLGRSAERGEHYTVLLAVLALAELALLTIFLRMKRARPPDPKYLLSNSSRTVRFYLAPASSPYPRQSCPYSPADL